MKKFFLGSASLVAVFSLLVIIALELSHGYRYLMGHLVRMANSELNNDPYNPHFERAVTFRMLPEPT